MKQQIIENEEKLSLEKLIAQVSVVALSTTPIVY